MSTDSEIKASYHPDARLCHVIKNDNFDGYGFNLHAEKGKPGQYIGKVDDGSPAELAGLRQGDRILEVNDASIANESHKQVVQRIKTLPNETKLLVVDPDDETHSNHDENDGSVNIVNDNISNASTKINKSDVITTDSANNGQAHENNSNGNSNNHGNSNKKQDMLNLSMTAAELRAKLASKKKFDPRKEPVDFKKKFDTVQKL